MVILTGMLCAMSLAVYGCGRENTPGSAGVGTGRENNKIPVPTPMEGTDDKDEKPKLHQRKSNPVVKGNIWIHRKSRMEKL